MRSRILPIVLLSALLGVGACSSDPGPEPSSGRPGSQVSTTLTSDGARVLSALRDGLDYVAYETPADLLAERPVAYVGVVEDVRPGRSIVSESEHSRTRDNSVVLRIEVTSAIKSAPGISADGMIHVSLPRGVNEIDADGTIVGDDPNPSVLEIRRALGGARVLVISQPQDQRLGLDHPSVHVEADPDVVPEDAALLSGMHPQTVVFDQGSAGLEAWPGPTFEELLAQVRDRAKRAMSAGRRPSTHLVAFFSVAVAPPGLPRRQRPATHWNDAHLDSPSWHGL
jgi:hypothetical protein